MPEHISDTNMWNVFENEFFITTDGEIVNGPLAGVRIEIYEDIGLMSVQGPTRHWEAEGTDFKKVVQKKLKA